MNFYILVVILHPLVDSTKGLAVCRLCKAREPGIVVVDNVVAEMVGRIQIFDPPDMSSCKSEEFLDARVVFEDSAAIADSVISLYWLSWPLEAKGRV